MRSDSRMSYKQVISGKTSTYHMDGGEPVIVKQPIDQSELEAAVLHNICLRLASLPKLNMKKPAA